MAEAVMMKNSGDGYRRADDGSWGKIPVAKTAAYTVTAQEVGTVFTNTGSSATVVFTLPIPKGGEWFTFVKSVTNKSIELQAPTGVSINGGTAAKKYANTATDKGTCTIVAISATEYVVQAEKGTWATNDS